MTKTEIYSLVTDVINGTVALDTLSDEDSKAIVDRMTKDIELSQKTSNGTRKPTEKQVANAGYRQTILALLGTVTVPMTIADICASEGLEGTTHNQVVALLNGLVKDGSVVKTYNKKVAQYELATENVAND